MASSSSHSSNPEDSGFQATEHKIADMTINEKTTVDDEVDDDPAFEGTKSAPDDRIAMQRMGKKQQLIVSRSQPFSYLVGNTY